ncbi:hypothetical protein BXZ70DRAFT_720945 [Cristinia sonorae]|uniref:Uncharacterized protein n=1 Tax=Cristinia sonorae TaxID=1940300 RepID=A0A8K0UU03_9AGAR|nr:hypothetical protein BXZ70DRAFT_720945 [Cristinia sonorae]
MKRLRRASLKSSDNKPQAVAAITSTSSSEPPLYARFATTHKLQNGSTPAKPVVSGPMALTPRPSLQRIPSRGTTSSERDVSRLRRVDSKSEQLTTPPPRMSSRGTLAAKAQSPPTPTPQPLQQSVSLDMGSNGLADQLRPAITRTNAPAATLFRPQPEFNDMVSQRLQAGIRAESGREIAEVQSAVRSPASFSTGVVSPSDRRDGELPSPTKPARRPSASVLPKEPKEDHRASESRPTASPQQRAAEAQPSAQVKASTSDYGSPQKAARNPPVTSRKRVSRAIEQQRISYDLSPENYQKIMQAQAGVSRQEEPIPPFTTEAAEESRVVLSPQPQSRRSPHNVSHDIPVSSTTGQTSTLIPSPPSPSKSRSSHPHRTRRLLNEQSSSPGPSSPSMVRKKYSPMAAFGLPVGKGVEAVAASVQSVEPDDKVRYIYAYSLAIAHP